MKKLITVAAVLAMLALPVLAQDAPKAELFGGYQYTRINPGSGITGQNLNGWDAALTGNVGHTLGITADISGAYKTVAGISNHDYFFLFGPTLASHSNESFTPFAHALFGVAHASGGGFSDNAFAMGLGGGLDVKVANHVAVRLGQFDYLMTRFGSATQNNFRYSAGIVFRFE